MQKGVDGSGNDRSMASVEHMDVRYVAHLARLNLTDDEAALFQSQLDQVVAYVQSIQELNVEGIEPTSHGQPVLNVLRPDVARPGLAHDAVLANAPERVIDEFKVPKIVE